MTKEVVLQDPTRNKPQEKDMFTLLGPMLQEFISSFGASLDPELWAKLIVEETKETEEALEEDDKENILKEMTDLMYVTIGFNMVSAGAEQMKLFKASRVVELMDILNKGSETYAKAVEVMGLETNFYEAFRRVHLSNMSKLGEDGEPIYRDDGKVLKGPNYREPDLKDLL